MQHCSICGYESPEGAKFCRQCGAPLFAESEFSGADTRNYGRQERTPAVSTPLPNPAPSVVDAFGSETARYYQAPAAVGVGTSSLPPVNPMFGSAPPAYAPPVSPTSPLKKKRRFLKWGGFLLAVLFSAGIGAAINEESNDGRIYVSPQDRERLELLRRENDINRTLLGSVTDQNERLREEMDRRLEDVQRAREEAERAAERGLPGLDGKELELKDYEYPDATSGRYSRIIGKELLTLRTKDEFETISLYYQKKLGKPYLEIKERNRKRALFQSSGTPSATILVQETNDRNQEKIFVLRSPFRFPKVEEPSPALAADKVEIDGKPYVRVEEKPLSAPKSVAPVGAGPKSPEQE